MGVHSSGVRMSREMSSPTHHDRRMRTATEMRKATASRNGPRAATSSEARNGLTSAAVAATRRQERRGVSRTSSSMDGAHRSIVDGMPLARIQPRSLTVERSSTLLNMGTPLVMIVTPSWANVAAQKNAGPQSSASRPNRGTARRVTSNASQPITNILSCPR